MIYTTYKMVIWGDGLPSLPTWRNTVFFCIWHGHFMFCCTQHACVMLDSSYIHHATSGVRWGGAITSWYSNVMFYCAAHTYVMLCLGWGGGNNVMVLRRHVLDRHDFYTYHTCYATSCSLVLDILNISSTLHHVLCYLPYLTYLLRYIMYSSTWHT
jgi:hypothetical protein